MKAIKRAFYGSMVLSACGIYALGSFNSFDISYNQKNLKNDFGIKFVRRIDDMNGEIVPGRMAASIPKFNPFLLKEKKVAEAKKEIKKKEVLPEPLKRKPVIAKKEKEETESPVIEKPEATIQEIPSASLVAGLYNKTTLENVPKGAGEINVSNGIISSLSVSFPDGRVFNPTFSRDEMVGNVFEYEDTGTNEPKSGLLYEIAEGHYMVTFTDDSVFNTVRLEFKTEQALKQPKEQVNWAMNEQNPEEEPKQKIIGDYKKSNVEVDEPETFDEDNIEFEDDFAKNEEQDNFDEIDNSDELLDEDPVAKTPSPKSQSYAFNFSNM